MKKLKQTLAWLLVLCMVMSFVPAGVFAAEATAPTTNLITTGSPFQQGTGDSNSFRIPALVTLSDGTLVAAADARWNTTYDGGGLDTMVAISKDGGENWTHSFANYLGDNGNVYNGSSSSCFIDPSLAVLTTDEDNDGVSEDTIFMLVDLYPYGVALNGSGNTAPNTDTGFTTDGYLKLDYNSAGTYGYYLKNGEIYANGSTDPLTGYTVDGHFNITDEHNNSTTNLFFADSPFKVARTGFLYLTKSTDGGESWSAPQLLNLKNAGEQVCLVGPGRGLVTMDDTIVFPVYSYSGEQSKYTGLVYSTDEGKTWNRTSNFNQTISSEATMVQLDNGNIRTFFRNDHATLCYTDYKLGNSGMSDGSWGTYVNTGVKVNSDTELSAIMYTRTVNGQQVILVSAPAGPNAAGSDNNNGAYRSSGKIFAGLLNDDDNFTMTWKNGSVAVTNVAPSKFDGSTYTADQGFFAYSCLTEQLDNGSVSILYEDNQFGWGAAADGSNYYTMAFKTYTQSDLEKAFGVTFDAAGDEDIIIDGSDGEEYEKTFTMKLGETFTETVANIYVPDGNKEDAIVSLSWDGTEATHSYATATLGTDANYSGETIDVADCLYTFTASSNGFVVQSKADPTLYLNTTKNGAGYPNATESNVVNLSAGNAENSFYLLCNPQNGENSGKVGYLYFYRNGDNRFDRVDKTVGFEAPCSFYLYRPAEDGDEGSTEIPGYVRVTSDASNVTAGDYLIAAEYSGAYYLLHPSTSTSTNNQYTHVAKVTGQTDGTDAPASTKVTITPKAIGNTTVQIGEAITYNVTVTTDVSNVEDVVLKVGDTVTKTIEGICVESGGKDDTSVATVTWDGTEGGTVTTEQLTAATLPTSSGSIECYITDGAGNFLSLNDSSLVNVTDVHEATLWTVTYNSYNSSTPSPTYKITSGSYYIRLSNSTLVAGTTDSYNAHYYTAEKGFFCSSNGGNIWIYKDGAWTVGNDNGHSAKAYILETVTNEVDASTTVTITGNAMGKTTAVVGDTQYNITVTPENVTSIEEIKLMVGETKIHIDSTGVYTEVDDSALDTSIATAEITGTNTTSEKSLSENVTAIESGKTYAVVNTRCGKLMNNQWADASVGGGGTNGLGLSSTKDNFQDNDSWTITVTDDGYYVRDISGKYLTIAAGSASLSNDPVVLSVERNGDNWVISQNGQYLNNYGNANTVVAGYSDRNDQNAQFQLCEITETATSASTEITFTGVSIGETIAVVGDTQYNITVKGKVVEIELEVGENFTYTDTTGNHIDKVKQQPDGTYATMAVSGTSNAVVKNLVPVTASTFDTGKRYVIENVRAANPDHDAYQPDHSVLTSSVATGGATGLVMNGPLDVNTSQTWTFTPSDNMYYVGRDNSYITLSNGNANMSTTAQSLSFEYVGGQGWLIYYNQDGNNTSNDGDYFLSDVGGDARGEAFGYTDKEDDGNYWNIYEVVDEQQIDATKVTFTGVAEGETTAIVGNTQYNITVVPAEVDDEVVNSATGIWTVDPEIQRQRYNAIINGKYKDLYTDDSWKLYESARQAAYKKLVEVTNAEYDSKEEADAALAELIALVDALETAAEQLVSATTISVRYHLDTTNGTLLDTREYKITSSDTTVTLPETIVVDDIAYKVTDTTLERQGEETSYDVIVTTIGKVGEGFVGTKNVGSATTVGNKITEMTVTTGISYDLDLAINTTDKTVEWSTGNDNVATVDENGNVTSVGVGITEITATVKDANGNIVEVNTIPITVLENNYVDGDPTREVFLYTEQIDNTTIWCVVNGNTSTAFEVIEGELIYGNFKMSTQKNDRDPSTTTAFSFFGDPDEAHALVYMNAINTEGDFYLLHKDGNIQDGNDYFYDTKDNGNSNVRGAGLWQALGLMTPANPDFHSGYAYDDERIDWTIVKEMVEWAITKNCDGGQGFTRRSTEGDLNTNLTFISDPMPRIDKTVDGVLPTTRKQANYRRYVEDMVAAVHELVYFKITVTQEAPSVWLDEAETDGAIEYTNVCVKDTVLPGAYLYTKELDQADGTWDGEISDGLDENGEPYRKQQIDITDQLNEAWTAEQKAAGKRIFEFYLMYEIQESDIPKFFIDNIANLDYNYKSHYSTGAQAAAADAEARISVVGSAIDNVVIDFGQSFTYQSHPYYNIDGQYVYTFDGLTNSHLKGAYVDGEYDAAGNCNEGIVDGVDTMVSGATAKYGEVKVYRTPTTDANGDPDYIYTVKYTPTAILQEADAVRIYGDGENGQKKLINGFLVYPATTIYYEEGFLENVSGWNFDDANKATTEQTFELLGVSQFDNHGTLTHYISNKKQAYGFDPIYDGIESNDNVEVASSSISSNTAGDAAKFTFTGTGFEIFANCTEDSGYVLVTVTDKNGNNVKMFTVNTVVKGGTTGATTGQTGNMNALPIVSLKDLEHGTYTVTLTKILADNVTEDNKKGSKTVTIDGVRITNTISDSSIYTVDLEDSPEFYQLRDSVMHAINIQNYLGESMYVDELNEGAKQVYADIITDSEAPVALLSSVGNIYTGTADEKAPQDLLDNGPKNELYLWPNQTLTFKVQTQRVIQVGLKAPSDATGFNCSILDGITDTPAIVGDNVYGATDMFYYLTKKPVENIDNTYVISITNLGSNVLAITDLKICDDPSAAFVPLTLDDVTEILRAAGYTDGSEPDVPNEPLPFEDVPADSFYYDSVAWAVKKGITNGVSETRFGPNAECNRAQAVTFLWRAAGSPEPTATAHGFVDVAAGSYYEKAVLWAVEKGITNGTDSTHFSPNQACSRSQVVTFLYRAFESPDVENVEIPFSDVPADAWYAAPVLWAVKEGITNGTSSDLFDVNGVCNRAQIVTFLYRAYN